MRGVPDVAGDADPVTGYQVRVDGEDTVIGGTSAVAPLWAGFVAIWNQATGKRVGFINPVLYSQAAASCFHDVTSGNNGSYSAGLGWDACSGWGSPDVSALLALFSGKATPSVGISRAVAKIEAPTVEQINQYLAKADLKAFAEGGRYHPAVTTQLTVPSNVCAAYGIIRPILEALQNLPFVPRAWKQAIQTFIALMDVLCPKAAAAFTVI